MAAAAVVVGGVSSRPNNETCTRSRCYCTYLHIMLKIINGVMFSLSTDISATS